MIKINLLPEEYRKKKKADFSQLFNRYKTMIIPGAGILVIIIVIISLVILAFPRLQGSTLRRFEIRWKNVEKDYQKVTRLKNRQKRLRRLLDNIEEITKTRIFWARCLNNISDSLPGEIQLTELVTKVEKVKDKPDRTILFISGIVPFYPGERAINDFVKVLRGFVEDFPQIEPPSILTQPSGFKKFTMKCYMMPQIPPLAGQIKTVGPTEEKKKRVSTDEII